ncbi:ATP-binding protein [Streptomyces rectiviolaceus]|uniref:Histidine kinase/HSP90-like ATPase domain-containing protein n=1 Tax=Streptomyces rectiviolaceus TaxID=332591 RepID=A0ABP6M872_9ACTN
MSPVTSAVAATASELQQGIGPGFAVAFTPDKSRVPHMRKITGAHLRLWRVPEATADNVILAVSELVTNGIQHGHGAVGLKVICSDGALRVEVTDGNPRPAQLAEADDDDLSGRGLFLVAVLAHNWGVSPDGHITWCVFHLPAGRP